MHAMLMAPLLLQTPLPDGQSLGDAMVSCGDTQAEGTVPADIAIADATEYDEDLEPELSPTETFCALQDPTCGQ